MGRQEKNIVRIVAFGDSITAAAKEMPDEAKRWPSLLETRLRGRFPGVDVKVVNAGVGGNTSREGLARMGPDVLRHDPDYVLVEFGGNDGVLDPQRHVAMEEFVANLVEMKARLDALGHCRMILLTFPPVIDELHAQWEEYKNIGGLDKRVEPYRRAAREFAAALRLPLVDIDLEIRKDLRSCILTDGVHLSARGNDVVAEAVGDVMEAELAKVFRQS